MLNKIPSASRSSSLWDTDETPFYSCPPVNRGRSIIQAKLPIVDTTLVCSIYWITRRLHLTLRATRLSNKLLIQGYVKERLKSSLRKFYGRYGDLIIQYEVSLSQIINDILWPDHIDHIQWQPPTDQTLYRTRPFTEFWVVSVEQLRRVWHADRGRLLLRTPGLVPLGLAYVLLVETNPFPNFSFFSDYALRISLGTFSILLWKSLLCPELPHL